MSEPWLPLRGVRVVDFSMFVPGPFCSALLADLGAEVIKVEPLAGDNTRRLEAAGAGFFPVFNRNKKSLAVDLSTDEGRKIVLKLLKTADVLATTNGHSKRMEIEPTLKSFREMVKI